MVVCERWKLELLKILVRNFLSVESHERCNDSAFFLGKFSRVVPAGFFCMFWPMENFVNVLSLRIQYMDVACETKTKDNVFIRVVVAVQYRVMADKVPSAYYKLTDPRSQIRSYVFDVVRSSVPRLEIDAVFASKDDIANSVRTQLASLMAEYGYEILATLVIDIDPNPHVKAAMNDINGPQFPSHFCASF